MADMRNAARRLGLQLSPLALVAVILALVVVSPILSVIVSLAGEAKPLSARLIAILLPKYLVNTAILMALVGVGVTLIGVGAAWLVTMYRFPGRRMLEVALALPLAFPAYVLAYAYTDLLSHPGAVQSALRAVTGWGPTDYWFPEVHSLPGAALMLTLVLYPYVYLLARAAFAVQAAGVLEVARTLGHGPWAAFWRVGLPMARPAIFGGAALAMMETMADYGVVSFFGVQTLATGVYRALIPMGDRVAAAQISAWLLLFVLAALALERVQRRARRFQSGRGAYGKLAEQQLIGWRGWLAFALCFLPLFFGFIAPLVALSWMSLTGGHPLFGAAYVGFAVNSVVLASIGAVLALAAALLIGYAARLNPSPLTRGAAIVASLGYAAPGSVIAVGVLAPLAGLDNALDAFMVETFGVKTGLLLTGSIVALLFAYLVRFLSVALSSVEAGLGKITPSMDDAARTLGETEFGALRRVHAPLLRGGMLAAALIVFVDIMKELPATMILAPFNFRTLAVQAHNLAADERLIQASTPSLAIVAVGLLPVLLLAREIRRSRPGSRG